MLPLASQLGFFALCRRMCFLPTRFLNLLPDYRLERLLAIANEPPKLPAPIPLTEIEAEAKHQIDVDKMLAQLTHKPVPEFSPEALVIEIKARTLAKIEAYERDKYLTSEIATSYRNQLEAAHGQG